LIAIFEYLHNKFFTNLFEKYWGGGKWGKIGRL